MVWDVGFRPDERIGNYRVETELGPTGAGILIQATHLVLPRKAIIKVVHSAFAAMQPYVLQTLREACILEAIAHPGVPVVYESGILPDRRPWFAFEIIAGPTLEELLAFGPVPVGEVAKLLRDLAEILEHAHRRGVLHRGLRPDRIVITPERRYPLCVPDWSEATAHDAVGQVPRAASEVGRCYLAPELADQGPDTREVLADRADVFALGVIAYRALTGELPFAPGHEAVPHVPAAELRSEAPPALAALIDSMLAASRFDRPSAAEIRGEIDQLPSARRMRAVARPAKEYDGRPAADAGALPEDVILLEHPRLRRSRWTPDVRYLETTPVEIKIAEDDVAT